MKKGAIEMAAKKKASRGFSASVLAYQRQLDPSDGLMASGRWDDIGNPEAWAEIPVREKSVRGTDNSRPNTKNGRDALENGFNTPNPQTVDIASLPHDADTLKASFTLKILGGVAT